MKKRPRKQFGAFSLLELFIVVGVLAVLLFILLPQLARRKAPASRTSCSNNMKQIGLSFKTFAIDNDDKFPFELSVTNVGTMELVSMGKVWPHFSVMSNELSTPKILVCPDDQNRTTANTFEPSAPKGNTSGVPVIPLDDSHLSYFIGLDAADSRPDLILSGDRFIGVDGKRLQPGLRSVYTNSRVAWIKSWHSGDGNLLMSDGSVSQLTSKDLRKRFTAGTNHLVVP